MWVKPTIFIYVTIGLVLSLHPALRPSKRINCKANKDRIMEDPKQEIVEG